MRVTLVLLATALVGASTGTAAPLPRGSAPAPEPDVSAPVAYQDLMLILVTNDGAAAVIFDTVPANGNGVEYSYRYESADGKKKLSGNGKLFERRLGGAGGYDPAGLSITAGPVAVKWSRGGTDRGWIYYAPEVVTVHVAHADNFKGRVHKHGPGLESKVEELDLRRFMKK
jgi:hypothetical protein